MWVIAMTEKIKTGFYNLSLLKRMIIYYGIAAVIPIILISCVIYVFSDRIITDMAVNSGQIILDRIGKDVNVLLNDAETIGVMIEENVDIQKVLRRPFNPDIGENYAETLMIESHMMYIQQFHPNIQSFYILAENGGAYKSNYYSIKDKDFRRDYWYKDVIKYNKPRWIYSIMGSVVSQTLSDNIVSYVKPIVNKATGKPIGAVLVDIDTHSFDNIIKTDLVKDGYIAILKDNKVISVSSGDNFNRIPLDEQSKAQINNINDGWFMSKNNSALILSKDLMYNGFKIAGVISKEEITKESREILYIAFPITAAFIVITLISIWNITQSILKPLNKLGKIMERVENGNLDVDMMTPKYRDELGDLTRKFNHMLEKIKSLMKKVYTEQEKLRKEELKVLQAQINPHFLYNTLDTIIWMSKENDKESIAAIAKSLIKLFRIGVNRGAEMISIAEEIEHVESYMSIQHIRYSDKFDYSINLPDSLRTYKTLNIILQPLVENSIYHGIKEKREKGLIYIDIYDDDENIYFEVRDTGKGMSERKLKALNNTLKRNDGEKVDSYGLINVNRRIKLYFGDAYGLEYESTENLGTTAIIRIPKLPGG